MRMDLSMMKISTIIILSCLMIVWVLGREIIKARDCREIKDNGFTRSGVYKITPVGTYKGFKVYCDMGTDGGGWMRRKDGSENFYRDWEDYQFGFGNVSGEHWLGDSLTRAVGTPFSTRDKLFPGGPACASLSYHGGWWYESSSCDLANLNGRYPDSDKSYPWFRWKYKNRNQLSLRKTEMKIRRI